MYLKLFCVGNLKSSISLVFAFVYSAFLQLLFTFIAFIKSPSAIIQLFVFFVFFTYSTISVTLTNLGIKVKIPGILSVLTPSYRRFKLYGDYKLEHFYDKSEIEQLQFEKYDSSPIQQVSDIEIGRTYKVIINNNGINDIESYTIITPLDYYNFKEKIQSYITNGSDFSIIEDITKGRELASYNTRFQDQSGKKYQLYDLDSCKLLFKLKEIIDKDDIAGINFLKELYSKEELLNISIGNEELQNEIELFFNNPDLANINYINTIFTNKLVEILIRRKLQKDLNALSKDHPDNIVYINNKPVVVNKDSIKVNPYEVIMPKTFMHEFGLKKYDELQKIKNDKYFFLKRMMSNFHTKLISEYDFDVELKNNNGEHYYILDSKYLNTVQNIRKADFYYKRNEDGKLFRTNDDKTKIFYEISSENDKIYTDNNGVDVIVTDNPEFYINNLHYDLLTFSMRDRFPYTEYMGLIKDIESAKESYEYLNTKEKSGLYTVEKLNEILRKSFEIDLSNKSPEQIEDEIRKSFPLQLIRKKANYTYTSFLKSLDIIAARIPAQNIQSFMPMKVVGFENPNINNAYVSTTQLWLQGSDY